MYLLIGNLFNFKCFLIFSKDSSKNNIVLLSKLYFLFRYALRKCFINKTF